jgi:DUF971 family protein
MTGPPFRPGEVGPSEDGMRLRIQWQDGHVSEYEPRYLRTACRCAGCVDEMTGRPILRPDSVPEDVHPLAINYVGRYALQFQWSDGHDTGIFPFRYLRDLCICEACRAADAGAD